MKDLIKVIQSRHSVRVFTEQKISKAMLNEIVKCGNSAPSANKVYPREIKVYQDKKLLELLSETQPWSRFVANASTCLVVLGYPEKSEYWLEDCSAATENVLLAAHALGLGSCWVAVRNMENAGQSASEYVKKILSLPEDCEVLCLVPIGYEKVR